MAVSCLCLSDKKVFLLNTTSVRLRDACPNKSGMKVAQNLLRQDYKALGNCVPPEANSYAIRLTYNPDNEKCQNNHTHPYFWGRRSDNGPCVDGQPLNLPSVQDRKGCHLATIIPGSSSRIFNETNLTRCNVSQPYICQLENNQSFPLCTGLKETKSSTITATTTKAAVAATTAMPNNVTIVAVGSVLGILALALILFLIYLCHKRNKTKRNADKSNEHENYRK